MKIEYKNSANKNGIYKIINVKNNRIYIGSTVRFKKRVHSHIATLQNNKHSNTFLQNDWNKCGEEAFEFHVIEVVEEPKSLLIREQHYLDLYFDNQQQCYNIRPQACDSRVGKKQRKPSDTITDRRLQTPNSTVIEKRSVGIRLSKSTPEQKEKAASNARNGLWKDHAANVYLVNRDTKEEVHVITSLRQFAIDRGLSYKSLHQLVKGKIKSSGGWYVKETGEPLYETQKGKAKKPLTKEHKEKIAAKALEKYKSVKLVDTIGNVVDVPLNIKEFCRVNEISYTTFVKLLSSKVKSCNGWTVLNVSC